ncbi:MAG TPA: hypothetical protein VIJ51_17845 [Solirubrobacteraceae bacterium]
MKAVVFELLAPEIEALVARETSPDDPLGKDSPVLAFFYAVYAELFASLGLATEIAFDAATKQRAFAAEEKAVVDGRIGLAEVFRLFGVLCDLYPDVLGVEYGGDDQDFEEVRAELVPELLSQLAETGSDLHNDTFAAAAQGTLRAYEAALRGPQAQGEA